MSKKNRLKRQKGALAQLLKVLPKGSQLQNWKTETGMTVFQAVTTKEVEGVKRVDEKGIVSPNAITAVRSLITGLLAKLQPETTEEKTNETVDTDPSSLDVNPSHGDTYSSETGEGVSIEPAGQVCA